MKNKKIDIQTPDGICDSFIASPEDNSKYPAVLLFMDAYGPRPWLYEMAEIIAAKGYFVLLPNIFYRIRKAPVVDVNFPLKPEDMPQAKEQLMAMVAKFNPQDAIKDTAVFLEFLKKQPQVSHDRIGITGYCMGGGLSIRAAAQYPHQVAVAASFHAGRLATDAPDAPYLLLDKIKAELYVGHADNDQSMPPEQIERLQKALEQSGLRFEAELYKGASHGFTMKDLPAYNEAALQKHWIKLFGLLEKMKEYTKAGRS